MDPAQEKQDTKANLLWMILGGNHYGHVTLNNLRMTLLAIKGLPVQPDVKMSKVGDNNFVRLYGVITS